nr:MAG TPA: hypothetical protein [Bacteriophage sp.]
MASLELVKPTSVGNSLTMITSLVSRPLGNTSLMELVF